MSDKQAWDELYVDIDDARADAIFQVAFKRLNEHFVQRLGRPAFVKALDAGTSESGFARTRRIVKLPRPTKNVHERILLESVLGSNPSSCLLAYIYVETGKSPLAELPPWEGGQLLAEGLPFVTEEEDLPFK